MNVAIDIAKHALMIAAFVFVMMLVECLTINGTCSLPSRELGLELARKA